MKKPSKEEVLPDFPSPLKMYKKQAKNYCDEAVRLATAYPMVPPHVEASDITRAEFDAVEAAARAWQELATRIERLYRDKTAIA